MEGKVTTLVIMGFLTVAGLSIGSVSCLTENVDIDTINSNVSIIVIPPLPTKYKSDLVLKVEAVYHEGLIKKLLSYSRDATSPPPIKVAPPTRVAVAEEVPQLPKYTEWFHRISPPFLRPPILTTADTTCQKKTFLWLPTGNSSNFLVSPKEEDSYTGLFSQCDPDEYPIPVEPRPGKFWYLNSCSSSSGNGRVNSRLNDTSARRAPDAAIPLYTIYVGIGAPNHHTMLINPVVNFNIPTFLHYFPFDRLEIQRVIIQVTLYTDTQKIFLMTEMKEKKYVVQEEDLLLLPSSSDSDCFVAFIYDNKSEVKLGVNSGTRGDDGGIIRLFTLIGVELILMGIVKD